MGSQSVCNRCNRAYKRSFDVRSGAGCLAEEVPVALVYNGISQCRDDGAPPDLEEFASLLTEGIIQNRLRSTGWMWFRPAAVLFAEPRCRAKAS